MTAAANTPRQIAIESLDTADGSRIFVNVDLAAASGVPADVAPDIHAIFRNGNNWDLILRSFSNNIEAGHVVGINNNDDVARDTGQTEVFRNPAGNPASSINEIVPFSCD